MIIHADARDIPLQDESVDCIVTSPPYFGCDKYYEPNHRYAMMVGTEKDPYTYAGDLAFMLRDCKRVLKPTGVMWLVIGDSDNQVPIPMAPQKAALELERQGWIIVQEITWIKMFNISGRIRYWDHPESKTEKIYMLAKTHDYTFFKGHCDGNAWKISPAMHGPGKWAVLPDKLVEKCIYACTIPRNTVLDPFCGSGTVERVASRMGRVAIGSDINPT